MTRLVAVMWNGFVGGAETFTVALTSQLRELGADASVLFVTTPGPLAARLEEDGIPYEALGLSRGREAVWRGRRLAAAATRVGPDGALVVSPGYLTAALRLGGYRGRIVAVVHDLFQLQGVSRGRRLVRRVDHASGVWANDVEVAVSDYVRAQRPRPHARRFVRIHNGVDLDAFSPDEPRRRRNGTLTVGFAGRLIAGKGVDTLLRAFADVRARTPARLRIAGDGPERPALERLAAELDLDGSVEFVGWSPDLRAFWHACDVAAVPTDAFAETFGMTAVEAMACGRPVVATRTGALPELVDDASGRIVEPGDARALADAFVDLGADADTLAAAGRAARERCEARFDLRTCAESYLRLFEEAS